MVMQWFRSRWCSLTEGVNAKRQVARHLERRRAAEAERAELVGETAGSHTWRLLMKRQAGH